MENVQTLYDTLKKYYGYNSFREGQLEIIQQTLSGRDTVVLMPTGGGKSLCYQLPSLLTGGVTLVVSPLIALMIDQVQALNANGIKAAALHSNQEERLNRHIFERATRGDYNLIYISPERLIADIDRIADKLPVKFVAVDEAHCISQWGHDFRPVYTSLKVIKQRFPNIPVMALTATADRLTRGDIATALGLHDPYMYVGSFDRPNISLSVIQDPGKRDRVKAIARLIDRNPMDSGIVYCLSRKKTEQMHQALLDQGYRSVCYHAGLSAEQRAEAQRAFVAGEVQVVCATIAFGMGIDKSNIRWVVHNNIPGNIESYYQEIGRAGRDGMPAVAILFYNYGDIITRRQFVEDSGQVEINNEKLDFMQRYAEASVCRRRILLSYFSQETTCDCGNCDNCRNPREKFDGTVLAQKALSAVIRINSAEGVGMVIDILRASYRQELVAKGYDKIKTYGAGRDLGSREWYNYILQMVQLGLFEVAYEDSFHLRPTPLGMRVVKGEERIELVKFREYEILGKKARMVGEPALELTADEKLLIKLKEVRKKEAGKAGIADYMVFSDATLDDMVKRKPKTVEELAEVEGVGEVKLIKFGRPFISAIRKFEGLKANVPVGTSVKETMILFEAGIEVAEIAKIKGIAESTVLGHLASLLDEDKITDYRKAMTDAEMVSIWEEYAKNPEGAYAKLTKEDGMSSGKVLFAESVSRWKLRHNP